MSDQLDYFGKPVTEQKIKVTKAGDGLSDALKLHGVQIDPGEEGIVVMRIVNAGGAYKPVKAGEPEGDYALTHTFEAKSAKVVAGGSADAEAIDKLLAGHEAEVAEAQRKAKDAAGGIEEIPFGTDADHDAADEDGVTAEDAAAALHAVDDLPDTAGDDVADGPGLGTATSYKWISPDGGTVVTGLTLDQVRQEWDEQGKGTVRHDEQIDADGDVIDPEGFYDPDNDPGYVVADPEG